jgi:hypothetical protein
MTAREYAIQTSARTGTLTVDDDAPDHVRLTLKLSKYGDLDDDGPELLREFVRLLPQFERGTLPIVLSAPDVEQKALFFLGIEL